MYYKINGIIICHMFLSFLSKKEKIQSMKFIKLDIYMYMYKVFLFLQKEKREKEKMSLVKRLTSGKIKKSKSSPDNEGADKISHTRYFVLL